MSEKEKILCTAGAMYLRYGIKSVSMSDIARELGISKKTLYQHVEKKEDLIAEVLALRIKAEKEMVQDAIEKSENAIDEILTISDAITKQLRAMSPKVLFELQKYYNDIFRQVESYHKEFIYLTIKQNLIRGGKEGIYRKELNAEIVARLYIGKSMMLVDEESFPLNTYHRDELFQEHIIYHIHGVASPAGIELLEKYAKTNEK